MTLLIAESAYEDEEQFARGSTTPGEDIDEEDDDQSEGDTSNFPLRMASDTTRGRITAVAGSFLRGTAGQHVNFDPEAPPMPTHVVQTTCLLERPEIGKKVKVTNEYKIDMYCFERMSRGSE